MQSVTFRHEGQVRGKSRPRAAVRGRRATIYTPSTQHKAEAALKASAMRERLPAPFSGPVALDIFISQAMPTTWSQKKQAEMTGAYVDKKPDSDNQIKTIMDALNGLLWADDRQVAKISYEKRYGITHHAVIRVTALTPQAQSEGTGKLI